MTMKNNKMTSKTTKTMLFASLIAGLATMLVLPMNANSQETPIIVPETFEEKEKVILKTLQENANLVKERESSTDQKNIRAIDSKLDANTKLLTAIQEDHHKRNPVDTSRLAEFNLALEKLRASDLPLVLSGASADGLILKLKPTENISDPDAAIRAIIGKNIPYGLSFGEFGHQTDACALKTDPCNPIVGGVKVTGEKTVGTGDISCSIGLEVKDGNWPWSQRGWITAGHCFELNANVKQPSSTSSVIGQVTKNSYQNLATCDCEFFKKTTSTPSQVAVWINPNTYTTITAVGDAAINDIVIISGYVHYDSGTVKFVNVSSTDGYGNTITNLVFVDGLSSSPGDSGGSVINIYGNTLRGTNVGASTITVGGTTYTGAMMTPWSKIQSNLGVYLP